MARFGAGTMMAIIFAILIGLGGAYFVRQLLSQEPPDEPIKPKPALVTVPTVAYDIPEGRVLVQNDIVLRSMTREQVGKRYSKFPEFMQDVSQIVGRRTKMPIPVGNPVQISNLWPDGIGPPIEEQLKPGFVAKPLPIDAGDPVLTYIAPGSMVDVYFTSTRGGVTVTLLERVEVLDVPKVKVPVGNPNSLRFTSPDAPSGGNQATITRVQKVTVAVSDYQAKALTMVEGKGQLRLALRKKNDFSTANTDSSEARMTIGRLLHDPVGIARKGMQVYQGGKANNIIFSQRLIRDERFNIQTPIPAQPPVPKAKSALGS